MRLPKPRSGTSFLRAAGLAGFLLLVACGEPEVGGTGRLEGEAHLVLGGSPRQMGWWQGRLLRDRIRRLHPAWQERAFRDAAAGDASRARTLRDACRVYVAQTLPLLPERLRQELDGLAEGSGLPAETLLLTEVLREGLRWHETAPRLLGGDLGAAEDGSSLACAPSGPDAAALAGEWMLVERRPEGGRATLVVSWPGSLGGVAGAAGGVALASAQEDAPLERQRMGIPFAVSLRLALEQAEHARDALDLLSRTTAHRVVAVEPRAGVALVARVDLVETIEESPLPVPPASAPIRAVRDGDALVLHAGPAAARAP